MAVSVIRTNVNCLWNQRNKNITDKSEVYWILHNLDSWIKTDQLDFTGFIISPFTGNIIKKPLHTRQLKNHSALQQPVFTETSLLKQSHTSQLITHY